MFFRNKKQSATAKPSVDSRMHPHELREALDEGRYTTQQLFEWIRLDELNFCAVIAEHDDTPGLVLSALARHDLSFIRTSVAEHPNTWEDTLLYLADEDDNMIQRGILQNPNAPLEMRKLAYKRFLETGGLGDFPKFGSL